MPVVHLRFALRAKLREACFLNRPVVVLYGPSTVCLLQENTMPRHPRRRNRRKTTRPQSVAIFMAAESVEQRLLLSAASVDGTGNNPENPEWGSVDEEFLRLAESDYADGISEVGGENRPSARLISNTVSDAEGDDIISDRLLSAMIYAWGQFIDHDITSTPLGSGETTSIAVPQGDPSFDPFGTGTQSITTLRSAFDPLTGTSKDNPREQVNAITAFIDGSMVYGSSEETASALRMFSGGLLKTSEGNLLPLNNAETFPDGMMEMDNANPFVSSDQLFAAGDSRANENVELLSLQTVFVREHNLQAERIATENPSLTDEQIYQEARSIVIAEIQAITYNEWLPSLLGRRAVSQYEGYDASVNPGISNEFATAAFRFGHSLLGDDVEFLDNDGLETHEGVALSEAFFNPDLLHETGIDSILKYLSADPSGEVDTEIVDSVRNFLFGPPGAGGLDLASLNIQRGRDHGLADYNTVRESIGLPRVISFADITADVEMQQKLKSLYGTVDNIDLWVGGLAEDHVNGSSVGETFQTIIIDQFERLRDGDRYWYQNQFSGRELRQLERTSLSDIIERNTDLTGIQQNAFFFKASISGTVVLNVNHDGHGRLGGRGNVGRHGLNEAAAPNITMHLVNTEDGAVVAKATTDRNGHYKFDVHDGLRTGIYQITAVDGDGQLLAESSEIAITGGDDFERADLVIPATPLPARSQPRTQRHAERSQLTNLTQPPLVHPLEVSADSSRRSVERAAVTSVARGSGHSNPSNGLRGGKNAGQAAAVRNDTENQQTTTTQGRSGSDMPGSDLAGLIDQVFIGENLNLFS